jgi:hypothetical protein
MFNFSLTGLDDLVEGLHDAVGQPGLSPRQTTGRVAEALRRNLPSARLFASGAAGDERRSELLYADPAFSIVAIFWRPGQVTRIHDHLAWCVFGVITGVEHEELFTLSDDGSELIAAGSTTSVAGDVSGFAPPGDIHRVRNRGAEQAISIHVYGTDLSGRGSSVRRYYDLPVRAAGKS